MSMSRMSSMLLSVMVLASMVTIGLGFVAALAPLNSVA